MNNRSYNGFNVTYLASVKKYVGLDYRHDVTVNEEYIAYTVTGIIPDRTKYGVRKGLWILQEILTLNCLTSIGPLRLLTFFTRYAFSFSTSMFARTSPYSPPIFFGDSFVMVG